MGHRLTKIYTRTGDQGTTGLGDGSRTDKDSLRMELIGSVDELNSALGLVIAESDNSDINGILTDIQHDLFDMGGELSMPGHQFISGDYTLKLEDELDRLNADLPKLKEFILPGGNRATATCHLARSICRRAERRAVTLSREETINPEVQIYLNRLSDLLFVTARTLARSNGGKEVLWQRGK